MNFSERAVKKSRRREEEPSDVGGSPISGNTGNFKLLSFKDAVLQLSPMDGSASNV